MKLKYKFSLILATSSILIGFGITYTLSSNYIKRQKESIYEAHTVSALHISEKISQYFKFLRSELESSKPRFNSLFPEVIAVMGKVSYNPRGIILPAFNSGAQEELHLLEHFFLYHTNESTILLNKNFLNKLTALAPSSSLALLPMNQNKIIRIAGDVQHPSSENLEQVLSQQNNQAVMANFSQRKGQNYLTVLAPLAGLNNVLLILQTSQQDISQVLFRAIKEVTPISIGVILLIILIAGVFTGRITKSLEELIFATKKIGQGHWKTELKKQSSDEVGQLIGAFNQLGGDLEVREQELIKVNRQLNQAEKLASLGMFSAGIAHEVKNPLGAILGNAQLIKRKLSPKNEDALRYSDVIINESYRATHIIEDLLVFAKERELNLTHTSVENLSQELLNGVSPKLNENEIELKFVKNISELYCDKEQLVQVLLNIILNGIDAFEEVTRENKFISVTYSLKEKDQIITISDNACGISSENISKIFEPFYSTKKIKKGTGLGMAICYGIIQKHQGQISVTSEVDKGSVFTICLPLKAKF